MGFYDGSFAFNTLDGESNGGAEMSWFFWPQIKNAGQQDSWRNSIMGGETRPELQDSIFTDSYPAGSEWHQPFMECAEMTHMSYILHHDAFQDGGYTGSELQKALEAHAFLGYAFRVSAVAASVSSNPDKIDILVTIINEGIAPFYYDLGLQLECPGLPVPLRVDGVENLIDRGESGDFVFVGIPDNEECLQHISLQLHSSYAYEGRPIRFAQGDDGRVSLSIPTPWTQSQEDEETDPPVEDEFNDPPADPPTDPDSEGPEDSKPTTRNDAEIFVDAGAKNEDLSIVSGNFWQNYNDVPITNSAGYSDEVFKTHRYGSNFRYIFDGLTPGSMKNVTLGFAETHYMACTIGGRLMDIEVNGEVFADSLDVFSEVGCQTVLLLTKTFEVNAQGELTITFTALADNAMVSLIRIDQNLDAANGESFWAWIINLILSILRGAVDP